MTQHTPGPWGICNNATPDRAPTEWVIGPMRGRNIITTVQSNGHDARLIAAAPELLEALERLLSFDCIRWLNDRGPIGEGWQSDELIAAIAAADEAIAKARGEVSQ